ncbi:MAG: FIST signal transduction protein [Nitriliruptoraceae bacterium]
MLVERLAHTTADTLAEALRRVSADAEVGSVLVLLAEEGLPSTEDLAAALRRCDVELFGGVFPRVIHGAELLASGGVVVGLPVPAHVAVVEEISAAPERFDARLEAALEGADIEGRTVITFVDGTSAHIDALLGSLFEQVGLLGTYLGGGAGSLSFEPMPCLLTRHGVHQDAAVIAVVDLVSTVGVAHGWQAVGSPLAVTAAVGRRIDALDHHPAVEVYEQLIAEHAGTAPDGDLFERAASYPLGIVQLDGELVVRDPVGRDGDALLCVGEIPKGAFVRLMYGDTGSLLTAAAQAAAAPAAVASEAGLGVVFDCVSRVLYLGDGFRDELEVVDVGHPRVGAATIGEVCNPGDRYLELYNKTVVAARLEVPDGDA